MRIIITLTIALGVSLFVAFTSGETKGKMLKCHCIVHDPTALQNESCWTRSVNRTYSVSNMRGNLTKVLNNVFLNIQLYKKTEIKYRPFLVNVTEDYCAFFAKNKAGKYLRIVSSIYLPYTNMNHTCPYHGEVYIKDVPMTTNKLPSTWPNGEYRLDVVVLEKKHKIITLEFFLEIFQNVQSWLN